MKALIKEALKAAARATGALGSTSDGNPTKARKSRLAVSGLIVAVLVDIGLETHIAEALVDFLMAVLK